MSPRMSQEDVRERELRRLDAVLDAATKEGGRVACDLAACAIACREALLGLKPERTPE